MSATASPAILGRAGERADSGPLARPGRARRGRIVVSAELDRRDPDRAKMRPAGPAGFREAWDILERAGGLWDRPPGHDPLRLLSGDTRDEVIVAVVMQQGDTFPLGHSGDEQIREADRPDLPAVP